jgi:hypothetical protein
MPLRVLPTMMSPEDSTIAARRAATTEGFALSKKPSESCAISATLILVLEHQSRL